jgi:hypothetical protein
MSPEETAIRDRRQQSNALIAAHDAPGLRPFFDGSIKLIAGDGTLLTGAEAVVAAFARQFREPGFLAYVRTTERVTLDQARARAAESGRWVGTWRQPAGETTLSGSYLAVWKKFLGLWVLESELYVQLAKTGASR